MGTISGVGWEAVFRLCFKPRKNNTRLQSSCCVLPIEALATGKLKFPQSGYKGFCILFADYKPISQSMLNMIAFRMNTRYKSCG